MSLVKGSKLEVENLDLQGFGLYSQQQKDELVNQGVPESDFYPGDGLAAGYWLRKSDEGVKRHTFDDKEIKLHSDYIPKNRH
jgi:hypothetical protein